MNPADCDVVFEQTDEMKRQIETGSGLLYAPFLSGSDNVRIKIDCTVVGEGISENEWGQSVLIKPDADAINLIVEAETAADVFMDGIEYKPTLRNETFFLKLKSKNDKYSFACKPPCLPTNLEKSHFVNGASFTMTCNLFLWVNLDTKKGGISFKPLNIVFKKKSKK
jgi:hypothetical protein